MWKSLFLSGRETNYPRNRLMISALEGFSTVRLESREKADVSKGGVWPILGQSVSAYLKSIPDLISFRPDFIFVGFFGHLITIPLRWISGRPIFFDAFISAQDTLIGDRQQDGPQSLLSWLARTLDGQSCRAADLVFVDSQAQALFFQNQFGLKSEKMRAVFVGCDENFFHPIEVPEAEDCVLFYGSYQPLHGTGTIVHAAKLLEGELPLRFRMIGGGAEYQQTIDLARELGLKNIEFLPAVPLSDLPAEISRASICLGGHFGPSEKARRVIPGKVFQYIAMGKAVIVGENDANRELLTPDQDALFCKMDDPQALATAIATLYHDPVLKERLGREAYQTYCEKAATPILQGQVQQAIREYMLRREGQDTLRPVTSV